ncbi:MAG TPA: DMT family transporter [Actinomycetota bacterium]|nr:DMT family transporter [Actinomycetota bacterium]
MRRPTEPAVLLLPTPVLWGVTFPAAKLALEHLPPFAFMAWTRALGALSVLLLAPLLRRADLGGTRPARAVLGPGLLLGTLIFAAYVLQTEGLNRTTATNAGFITGLYVVFTPVLAALLFRERVPRAAWAAVVVSVLGMGLLSVRDLGAVRLHSGDLLVLAGAVAWAGHVVAVGHYSPRFSPWALSLAQMTATAGLQLLAAAGTGLRPAEAASWPVWGYLVLTGALGSGVAYTLQVLGQQSLTATRAVVLLAGEALFAAFFAAVWLRERLALHQWAGAGLVLAAMAVSELSARRPAAAHLEPASAP